MKGRISDELEAILNNESARKQLLHSLITRKNNRIRIDNKITYEVYTKTMSVVPPTEKDGKKH